MKVSATITSPRIEGNIYNISYKIKNYGLKNDYPQKVMQIIDASGTGKVCFDIYSKFIEGAGFAEAFGSQKINSKHTVNDLLRKCARDLRMFNGFAILIKYNGLGEEVAYHNVPFEHCRLQINSERKITGLIAIHPDWTGLTGITIKQSEIKYLTQYSPETVISEMKEAGGPEKYLGQVLYYTGTGDFEYPICPFDAVITDMLTEESVSTVKHRNAKHSFLPSGVLVRKGIKPATLPGVSGDDQATDREDLLKLQGDTNAAKIWVVDVDRDEEKPEFIPFDTKNFDRQYELTEKTVQENIARMSMIPPILRGVDIGAGFGADLMENAYKYMNSITTNERKMIESVFNKLFQSGSIQPLSYITV